MKGSMLNTCIALVIVAGGTSAAVADLQPGLLGGNIDLSEQLTTNRGHPAAAYNSTDNEYVVVWFDSRISGQNDVYGQRVSADGSLPAGNFDVVVALGSHTGPAVAYNPLNNDLLVTWKQQTGGPGSPGFNNRYGQRITADGSHIGGNFHVSNGGLEGSLVHNALTDEYMHEGRNFVGGGASGVRGQRITSAGVVTGPNITVASAGAPAPAGQVGCDDVNSRYLGTWRDQTNMDLRGQLIDSAGLLIGGPVIISSIAPSSGSAASLAFDPVNDQYLVIFGNFSAGEIWGQFVSSAGALIGNNFLIIDNLASSTSPYVTYSPVDQAYLVAWKNGGDIEGQLLLADGSASGDVLTVVVGTAVDRPRLAANTATGDFIVVWRDNRNSTANTHDIFAQLVEVTGGAACPPDVNGDNVVDVLDLLAVLAAWGNAGGVEDINADGVVDVLDLLAVLAAWGPC